MKSPDFPPVGKSGLYVFLSHMLFSLISQPPVYSGRHTHHFLEGDNEAGRGTVAKREGKLLNRCRVVGPGCRQLACGLTYTPLVEQRLEVLIVGGIDDHRHVFGVASHLAAQRRHGKVGREYPICILHHAVDALQEFVYLLLTEVSRSLRSGQHGGLDSQFPILVDEQAVSLSLPAGLPDDDDQHDEKHKDQCSKEDDGPCLSTDLGGESPISPSGATG